MVPTRIWIKVEELAEMKRQFLEMAANMIISQGQKPVAVDHDVKEGRKAGGGREAHSTDAADNMEARNSKDKAGPCTRILVRQKQKTNNGRLSAPQRKNNDCKNRDPYKGHDCA